MPPAKQAAPHAALCAALQQAALLTKHQKLPLIAPALATVGIQLQLAEGFDTDSLGTFAGEVPRQLSPVDCVKTKARLGAELTALPFGLGSEGSFGGGPLPGLLNWDDELLCLYEAGSGQFIIAHAAGPIPLSAIETDEVAQLRAHIEQQDSQQGWICSTENLLLKGLVGVNQVLAALTEAGLLLSDTALGHKIRLSPDLRAHLCPSRRLYIQQAAAQLADRLQSKCPNCAAPDFWRNGAEQGLPCEACHYPTQKIKIYHKSCSCCGYSESEAAQQAFADPAHCPLCNP